MLKCTKYRHQIDERNTRFPVFVKIGYRSLWLPSRERALAGAASQKGVFVQEAPGPSTGIHWGTLISLLACIGPNTAPPTGWLQPQKFLVSQSEASSPRRGVGWAGSL